MPFFGSTKAIYSQDEAPPLPAKDHYSQNQTPPPTNARNSQNEVPGPSKAIYTPNDTAGQSSGDVLQEQDAGALIPPQKQVVPPQYNPEWAPQNETQ